MLTRQNCNPSVLGGALTPLQAIALEDVLALFTTDDARSLDMDNETRSCCLGKWADFAVLTEAVDKTAAHNISLATPRETYWKGQQVFAT